MVQDPLPPSDADAMSPVPAPAVASPSLERWPEVATPTPLAAAGEEAAPSAAADGEPSADGAAAKPTGGPATPTPAGAGPEAEADHPDRHVEPFSQLLESRPADGAIALGQRVRGKIISIGDDDVIVSISGRPDAVLPTQDLRGPDGVLLLRVDDPVSVVVQSLELPMRLTLAKKRGLVNAVRLRAAYEEKRTVHGTVRAVNKGGFEVRVHGVRAFCPLSQMDFGMALEPQTYVGQNFVFRVLRWENGGRNIVLSRRAVLKAEAEQKSVGTREKLAVGAEFDGIVKRVQPFGAFVDIGGVEGLLHVSRMGRGGVTDPAAVVSAGQTVRVLVTRIDNPGSGKERIALAAPDLGPDPWESARETLHEGDTLRGRVVRLAEFGAFVHVAPGIDGLLHVSELPRRGDDGTEPPAIQPGDEVEVRILKIDWEKKRVSLSMRPVPAARPPREARRPRRDRDRDREPARDRPREPSPFATGGSLTHTMAEQLGALRRKLQVRP
jgi:small subunit ribosomal protein S1